MLFFWFSKFERTQKGRTPTSKCGDDDYDDNDDDDDDADDGNDDDDDDDDNDVEVSSVVATPPLARWMADSAIKGLASQLWLREGLLDSQAKVEGLDNDPC